jgi:AcrR family transcriptional regulator
VDDPSAALPPVPEYRYSLCFTGVHGPAPGRGHPAARPHDRWQLIVEAAGQVFSERGYHAASMEEIAGGVGISAGALYRHIPNKYALFAACAQLMADRLVAALDEPPPGAPLRDLLAALVTVTVAHRASGVRPACRPGGSIGRAGCPGWHAAAERRAGRSYRLVTTTLSKAAEVLKTRTPDLPDV